MLADLLERAKVMELTTTGRRSGQPHAVELWFVFHPRARAVYLLSYPGADGRGTDWYRNALANPQVTLAVRGESIDGVASPAPEAEVEKIEQHIRGLFADKYGPATVSYWYGDEGRLPLKVEITDLA